MFNFNFCLELPSTTTKYYNNTCPHVFSVIELPYFLKYADARRLAQRALITCISYSMVPGTLVTAYPLLSAVSILSIP